MRMLKVYLELEDWTDPATLSRRNKYGKVIKFDMDLSNEAIGNLIDSLAYNVTKTMKEWWEKKEEIG